MAMNLEVSEKVLQTSGTKRKDRMVRFVGNDLYSYYFKDSAQLPSPILLSRHRPTIGVNLAFLSGLFVLVVFFTFLSKSVSFLPLDFERRTGFCFAPVELT